MVRRSGKLIRQRFKPVGDGAIKISIARSAPRRKKKVCKVIRQKVRNETPIPEGNHFAAPSYNLPYSKALEVYKTIRKGKTFLASSNLEKPTSFGSYYPVHQDNDNAGKGVLLSRTT